MSMWFILHDCYSVRTLGLSTVKCVFTATYKSHSQKYKDWLRYKKKKLETDTIFYKQIKRLPGTTEHQCDKDTESEEKNTEYR